MDATFEVIIILSLVGLSAVFSGMEAALVALSETRLRRRIEETVRAPSKMLLLWRDKPNDVLATLLIGSNLANVLAAALSMQLASQLIEESALAIPIAVGALTLALLTVGEVIPKSIAQEHPERYLALLPIVGLTFVAFYPLMRVLVVLARLMVRWLGGDEDANANAVTEDDIEEMVRIGKHDGSMSPVHTRLLTGIFDLDDKVAREVMVPRTDVKALHVSAETAEVVALVATTGYSRYPVYGESIDDIVGVLYAKDFLSAALAEGCSEPPRVADLMRKPMIRSSATPLQDLLMEMQRQRVHLAVIASEYGGVEGILTLEDIVEEVFGPIYDEHDSEGEGVERLEDGHWIVEGVLTMSELEAELEVEFPEDEDYETVAGLLMKACGAMPEPGFSTEVAGYRFEVVRADSTRVHEVRVDRIETIAPVQAQTGS